MKFCVYNEYNEMQPSQFYSLHYCIYISFYMLQLNYILFIDYTIWKLFKNKWNLIFIGIGIIKILL